MDGKCGSVSLCHCQYGVYLFVWYLTVEGLPSERAKPKVLVPWALVQEEPGEDEDDQQDEIDGQEVENESREEYVEPRQPKRRKTSHRRLQSIDSEDSDSD